MAPVTSLTGPPWPPPVHPLVPPLVRGLQQPIGSQQTLGSVCARGFAAKEAPGSHPEVLAWMSRPHGPQMLRHWCANADHMGKVLNTLASPQHCCWAQEIHRRRHMPEVPWMCSTGSPTALGRQSLQTQTACHYNFIFTVNSQSPEQQSPAWDHGRPDHSKENPQGPGDQTEKAVQRQRRGLLEEPQHPGHTRGVHIQPTVPGGRSRQSVEVAPSHAVLSDTSSDGKVVAVYQVRRPPHQALGLVAQVHQHPPQGPGLAQGPPCSVLGDLKKVIVARPCKIAPLCKQGTVVSRLRNIQNYNWPLSY